MSATEPPPGSQPSPQEPTEEELRAAYEAELSRITSTDMIAQAVISLLNLGARRLAPASAEPGAPPAERDLEQARDAIDAARALLEILERRMPQELGPLRDALSRLLMAYAREASEPSKAESQPGGPPAGEGGKGGEGGEGGGGAGGAAGGQQPADEAQRRPGPAESSGRLWIPGR